MPDPPGTWCEPGCLPLRRVASVAPRRRKTKNGKDVNPTLANLRQCVGADTPEEAETNYRPYSRKRPQKIAKEVFRVVTRLSTALHQILFLATNNSSTIGTESDEMKSIKRFKIGKSREWTLTESMAAIAYRKKNTAEEYDMKVFLVDVPALLHIFFDKNELIQTMTEIADELSKSWNDKNSSADVASKRREIEIPVLIDFRKMPYKSATELMLVGTTYNFNLQAQNVHADVFCTPDDVMFQLRLQDSEGEPKRGMAIFSLKDWITILESPEFTSFYQQLWNYSPLPQEYSARIEEYAEQIEDRDEKWQPTENKTY